MRRISTVTIAGLLVIFAGGCATKKHVQAKVDPLDSRLGDLESKSKQVTGTLSDHDRAIARADERAQGAQEKAEEAARAASKANEEAVRSSLKAEAANADAGNAKSIAEQGLGKTGELAERLANFENYKLVAEETVLFGFGQSTLSAEAKEKLGSTAAKVRGQNRFAVEVQGFTDSIGSAARNLELSELRAQAVVRYLTLEHRIPLRRIFVIGLGSAQPVAEEKTAASRKLNRRVEIRLYSAGADAAKLAPVASAQ